MNKINPKIKIVFFMLKVGVFKCATNNYAPKLVSQI
jgi:hypothetical protein